MADSATVLQPAPVESPSDADVSFISDPFVAFLEAPVFLAAPPGLDASFRPLLGAVDGDLRRLMSEGEFYALATSIRPPFTEAVGDAAGKMSARSLFSIAALRTQAWLLPGDCEPELLLRAFLAVSATGSARWPPAFNGELKTAGNRRSIEQSVVYTAMDMVRIFFPATAGAPCLPRFFALPPVGYALVGYPHVAYLLALEWVGKLIVSPISQPFLLGSPEHEAAVRGLARPAYAEPVGGAAGGARVVLGVDARHPLGFVVCDRGRVPQASPCRCALGRGVWLYASRLHCTREAPLRLPTRVSAAQHAIALRGPRSPRRDGAHCWGAVRRRRHL